jgi:xanthine dehydrogenase accessory factor
MIKQLQSICHLLEDGDNLVLATIIKHVGSTPRSVGSKMVVRPDGSITGTIGGGLVEHEIRKLAGEVFKTGKSRVEAVDLTGADAATTDQMICGGRLEILLELIVADPENIKIFRDLTGLLQNGHKGFLIKPLDRQADEMLQPGFCLVQKEGVALGHFPGASACIPLLTGEAAKKKCPVVFTAEGRRYFVEPTFLPGTVYLFGAGHVSRPVAELAAMVDFKTVVLDDRVDYANKERFSTAEQILILSSFDDIFHGLDIDRDSYLVIVTRGHLHDKTVLEQALRTNAGYIGMIGSKRKRAMVYEDMLGKGFTEDDLKRVYNPIGIDIFAETPEEIAVSVVAELIMVRARAGH